MERIFRTIVFYGMLRSGDKICFILSEKFAYKPQQIAPYIDKSNIHVGIHVVSFVFLSFKQTQYLSKTIGKLFNNQNPRKSFYIISTRCIQRDKQIQRRQGTRLYKFWLLKIQVKTKNTHSFPPTPPPRKWCQIVINFLNCRKIHPFFSHVAFYMASICTNHAL